MVKDGDEWNYGSDDEYGNRYEELYIEVQGEVTR